MDYKTRYKSAYLAYTKATAPTFYEMSGGEKMRVTVPDVKKTNGLTTYVANFLKYHGHYANRINVSGRMVGKITKTESGATFDDRRMIKSSTKKGTADLMCSIRGRMVCLEIKNRHTRDRASDKQDEERDRVRATGAVYERITDVEQFLLWYDNYCRENSVS